MPHECNVITANARLSVHNDFKKVLVANNNQRRLHGRQNVKIQTVEWCHRKA